MTTRETEIRDIRDLQAAGIISAAQAEALALAVMRKYAMATEQPAATTPAATTPAAAAEAATPPAKRAARPAISAAEYEELAEAGEIPDDDAPSGIAPQELPPVYNKETGKIVPTRLSKITVRAAEDGEWVKREYRDRKGNVKTKSVYIGNGQPTGRIAIGVNYNSKLSLSYKEWLQFLSKLDDIKAAVNKVVETCQPSEILVL